MCVCMHVYVHACVYTCVCACSLVQAEYWHDPLHPDKYRKDCVFLPDINQENVSCVSVGVAFGRGVRKMEVWYGRGVACETGVWLVRQGCGL